MRGAAAPLMNNDERRMGRGCPAPDSAGPSEGWKAPGPTGHPTGRGALRLRVPREARAIATSPVSRRRRPTALSL